MKSIRPGKQRKILFNAPLHKKRKWLSSHLEENLLLKYDKRSLPVIKGDTIKVMRGSYKGHEDKVAKVDVKSGYVEVEGVTIIKADGKKIPKLLHASSLLITKLNLTDKWRRQNLEKGLSEEAKKEIEREAEQQLKDAEEQKRKEEEERKREEARQKAMEEKPEETVEKTAETKEEKPKTEEKTEEIKSEKKEQKKPETKKETKKKTTRTKTKKKEEEK